jgi:hypothetical protein
VRFAVPVLVCVADGVRVGVGVSTVPVGVKEGVTTGVNVLVDVALAVEV